MQLKNKTLSSDALLIIAVVFFAIDYFMGGSDTIVGASFGLVGTLCLIFGIIGAIRKRLAKNKPTEK